MAERLKIALRDNATTFRVLPSSESRNVTVALTQTGTADDNPIPMTVQIEKGLKTVSYTHLDVYKRQA